MNPQWQRARVVSVRDQRERHLIGREHWVQGPPQLTDTKSRYDDERFAQEALLRTNLLYGTGEPIACAPESVELLARSPEDFADSVPFIPFDEWSSQDRKDTQ